MRAEACSVSFYRYLYDAVGEPWLWFERRDGRRSGWPPCIEKPTTEIFVLYVGGVPAGYLRARRRRAARDRAQLFRADPRIHRPRLGAIPAAAGGRPGLVPAARPAAGPYLHLRPSARPGAYQRAGFVVYARRKVSFDDPRLRGVLPRSYSHPLLPEFDAP